MQTWQAYLRLTRPFNIAMIAVTLPALWERFIAAGTSATLFSLCGLRFFTFYSSVLLLTAAGYVINDIYDQKIDSINKPAQQLVGRRVSPAAAWRFYALLLGMGLCIAVFDAYYFQTSNLVQFYVGCSFLLWVYSYATKCSPLLGNVLVAFTGSWTLLQLCYIVAPFCDLARNTFGTWSVQSLWQLSVYYFLVTLLREMVKDMEDVQGDAAAGCRTLPAVIGIGHSKRISYLLLLLLASAISAPYVSGHETFLTDSWWIIVAKGALLGGYFYITYKLYLAKDKPDFSRLSRLLKYSMLAGLVIYTFF